MGQNFMTVDGNTAAAHVAYEFTEVAAIYPITPSSPMAGSTDKWSANGRENMFGQRVRLVEMQSEAGAIAAVHGALQAGALGVSYTSSQGLMLMIPTLFRIAGERLPAVLHVASRTVGTHAMSIFGDHSDVMACRQTGFAQLSSGSVQEAADLAAVAHLSAVKGSIPFMHFFDGFRTSHELSRIDMPDVKQFSALLDHDALDKFREHALNPEHPLLRATVQNGDVYFQVREANNPFYNALPEIVEDYMQKVGEITGREYHLFNYYGDPEATDVIIAMGSVSGAIRETVDYLNARGRKTGFLQVHLYRPFSAKHFLAALPESVQRIAVLDRCKEMGSAGEPLYLDVTAVLKEAGRDAFVIGGRYGLSSKDTDPMQMMAVFENLRAENPVRSFTVGIHDDVTHLSLESVPMPGFGDKETYSCKFWGLGGDGTVGANHNTVQILGDCENMYAQAYFEYDAKKSFGVTKSHLRLSKNPILSSYYVKAADFVACHNQSYIHQYDIAEELKEGGAFLLNCTWTQDELEKELPGNVKKILAERHIRFYTIDATAIAQEMGLGSHTNTVLQAAFFKITGLMDAEKALDQMKDAARRSYFNKGEAVIAKNIAAIDAGATRVHQVEIPASWANAADDRPADDPNLPDVVKNILFPINRQKGDDLPVSAFKKHEDGSIELGLTAYEKRGIAVNIPVWDKDKCIQCNQCAFVCPHAVIRPYLLTKEEAEAAPEGFETVPAIGVKGGQAYLFSMQVSTFDCTGCGSCASVCPAKEKALTMVPAHLDESQKERFAYALSLSDKGDVFNKYTVKGSQFKQPLLEFSAACAGCGETPYGKLLTQLFGDRVYWANATGCSQAWGAPMPGIPYTTNRRGFGPAWTNCLFENNAELQLGIYLSVAQQREAEKMRVGALKNLAESAAPSLYQACLAWEEAYKDFDGSRKASDALIELCEEYLKVQAEGATASAAREVLKYKDQLAKKTFWMFGGDGWAYDIGFGGLDHVIASGENINVFVIDTEVYSNTGGQSSKATQVGAVAQFASAGKKSRKKDLGAIMMTYGNVYVAQVAMGADMNQLVKVIKEAEEYDGPSVIIAYCPCTSHGIRNGMDKVQEEMKRAVASGYWNLYHYDPRKEHPMKVDSKEPTMDYQEFLEGENRYLTLEKTFPENAEKLFEIGRQYAKERYEKYKKMEEQ
ncbi:MAG: pyruvate:ferredoxin (flavodoxin) oxidoreductase [Lachnospiraceae bacterium]|nr:pyruvate:ferredoxin (flavodoxin) oxidoreductase [Lachnospiraceae bacterium]